MTIKKEVYTVKILRHVESGVAVMEQWLNKEGFADRADGPAFIDRNECTGRAITKQWFKNGQSIDPPKKPSRRQTAAAKPQLRK